MKKKLALIIIFVLLTAMFAACAKQPDPEPEPEPAPAPAPEPESEPTGQEKEEHTGADIEGETLTDGIYKVKVKTDSSMFHLNETSNGMGELTVKDGKMILHITLVSKKIVNLYYGLAEDAKKEGAVLIQPTIDVVTYSDGTTEEVYGFDIPVPAVGEEFNVAIVGKGRWYDHKIVVSDPVPEE